MSKPQGKTQLYVISWGLGVCSTAMAVMSVLGDLPPVGAIINCDPGWELPATYEARDFYADWFRARGATVICDKTGDIRRDRPLRMPLFTGSGVPLTRRCTGDYKRDPSRRIMRGLAGYDKRRPPHPPADTIEMWLGFTLEEWHRMKPARQKYLKLEHPLVHHKVLRSDCISYLEERALPIPPRSACVCCPYRRASQWLYVREFDSVTWTEAIAFDQSIRNRASSLPGGHLRMQLYLFRGPEGPEPLETAPLEQYAAREKTLEWFQLPLLCGDGGCWT